jgi:hypothetical protein
MAHIAISPCDQAAVVAGGSAGNLIYLQITTSTPTLSII